MSYWGSQGQASGAPGPPGPSGWYQPAAQVTHQQKRPPPAQVSRPLPGVHDRAQGNEELARKKKELEARERRVSQVLGTMDKTRPGKEIKLSENYAEIRMYDDMADLFSIIKATEHWERAYRKGYIEDRDYTAISWSLINTYKTTRDTMTRTVTDMPRFMSEYKMDVPGARRRLVEIGVPATVEHGEGRTKEKENESRCIATVVASFITVMDAVKLNMVAVDQLVPGMTDIMENLNQIQNLPPNFEGKVKVRDWLTRLNGMSASDSLDENQARQIMLDLDSAYNAFHRSL